MPVIKVMVCVTRQITCARLIATGAHFVDGQGELSVVHVAMMGSNFLDNPREGEALDYLFNAANEYGAALTVLRSDDVIRTLSAHARRNQITHIILGVGAARSDSFFRQLKKSLPNVEIIEVPEIEHQREIIG